MFGEIARVRETAASRDISWRCSCEDACLKQLPCGKSPCCGHTETEREIKAIDDEISNIIAHDEL